MCDTLEVLEVLCGNPPPPVGIVLGTRRVLLSPGGGGGESGTQNPDASCVSWVTPNSPRSCHRTSTDDRVQAIVLGSSSQPRPGLN